MISRVFVVDDERVIASTLTAILTVNGYDARCFVNPLEALEAARTAGPDLLISDVDAETATALVANAGTDVVAAPTEHQQKITRIRIKGMWGSLATRDNATVGTAPVWNGNLVSIVRWQFAGIEVLPRSFPAASLCGKTVSGCDTTDSSSGADAFPGHRVRLRARGLANVTPRTKNPHRN